MSTITEQLNNGNFAIFHKNIAKIFIFDNKFETVTFLNDSGAPVERKAGLLVGRVASSNKVVILDSIETNGSQIPVGFLAEDLSLDTAEEVSAAICISGEVAFDQVDLVGNTLATVIDGKTLGDRIKADTMGIKLVTADELTGTDND